ncbi:N-terminal acetyltransferase [Linnemannia exigua]|uniref:N-terminal acetyltransferase n=1 Tax=Linnemannia exigua TaxID=604196 RepID=A0AAD4D6V9_9FUNG|nr:N-terminal acetyltransferase [Linnemannia exigua]
MSIESTPPQEHFTREQLFGILNRIAFPLSHLPPNTLPAPTLETLQLLQTLLVITVPFETLSLRTTQSRAVDISLEGIYNRVVVQKRGGWCFSLNRLAYELLLGLGFRTQFTIARVCKPIHPDDPPRYSAKTHRVSIVRFLDEATGSDTKYLFDIGFGNTSQLPLQLKMGATVEFAGHIRRMSTRIHIEAKPEILGNDPLVMWCIEEYLPQDDKWSPCYSFTEQQFYENDCEVANFYTCHSPTSIFFKAFWCVRSTREGEFYILIENKFMIKNAHELVKKIDFQTEQDRLDVLEKYFDIKLTEDELKYHDSWIVPASRVVELDVAESAVVEPAAAAAAADAKPTVDSSVEASVDQVLERIQHTQI